MKIDNIKEIIKLLGDEVPDGEGYPVFTQSGSFCHLVRSGTELARLSEIITGLGEPVIMSLARLSISQVMKGLSDNPGTTGFLRAINDCPVLMGGYYVVPGRTGKLHGPSGNLVLNRHKGFSPGPDNHERRIILYSGDNPCHRPDMTDWKSDLEPWAIDFVSRLYSHMNDIPRVPKFLRDNNGLKDLSKAWVEYVILKYTVPYKVADLSLFKKLFELVQDNSGRQEEVSMVVRSVSDTISAASRPELLNLSGLSDFLKWGPSAVSKLSHMKEQYFPINTKLESWI